jgi:nucleotide-binding universal stress UspA family protein
MTQSKGRTGMFERIMVPVDLAHRAHFERALDVAADLARRCGADLVLVGATSPQPGVVGRTPADFTAKIEAFARDFATRVSVPARAEAIVLQDVTVDLDRALIAKARELGADLIVMGSHVPGALDHLIASNAGYVAAHAAVSVFVVRG